MENLAYDIKHLIQEKLFLYGELKKILEQERKYIGDMDVAALWRMTDQKNQIVMKIEQKREQILLIFEAQKTLQKMGLDSFSLTDVINGLPFPVIVKSDLKKIKVQLDILKKELVGMAFENKRHANEHLEVVNGIFETIVDSEHLEKYSNQGQTLKNKDGKSFLRAEV